MIVILNPVSGVTDMFIGGSSPSGNEANTFILKPVAGENYLEVTLDATEDLYLKSRREDGSIISWIQMAVPA